jgi:bZIP-type transcription factor MBZ1
MQLWSRLSQHQPTQSHQQPPPISGLAAGLRPHYFTSPPASSSSISSLLSGKHASILPSPPSSPKLGPTSPSFTSSKEVPTAQQAMLAAMASQTLLQRLGRAFWQAFIDHSPSNGADPNTNAPSWDADKIRRVLEGKAVVSVVDIEPEANVDVATISSTQAVPNNAKAHESAKGCGLTAALDESMRALSLSKE